MCKYIKCCCTTNHRQGVCSEKFLSENKTQLRLLNPEVYRAYDRSAFCALLMELQSMEEALTLVSIIGMNGAH